MGTDTELGAQTGPGEDVTIQTVGTGEELHKGTEPDAATLGARRNTKWI